MPVLELFGDQDVLVNFRDSMQVYRGAFSAGGNRDLTTKLFRGANHGLTVGKDEGMDERYLRTMRAWLTKRVGCRETTLVRRAMIRPTLLSSVHYPSRHGLFVASSFPLPTIELCPCFRRDLVLQPMARRRTTRGFRAHI